MYRPVFTRQPESWQEWWTAVHTFTATWYGLYEDVAEDYAIALKRLAHQEHASLWQEHPRTEHPTT